MATIVLSGIRPNAELLTLEEDGTTVHVTAGAIIGRAGGPFAIYGRDVSNTTVQVDGTIMGDNWNTIDLLTGTGSSVTVGESGRVLAGPDWASGMEMSYDATILNQGEIRSENGFGVIFADPDRGLVTNTGTIYGAAGGVYFAGDDLRQSAYLRNSGHIEAGEQANTGGAPFFEAVFSNAGYTQIDNSGVLKSTREDAAAIRIGREGFGEWMGTANVTNSGSIESNSEWGIDLRELHGTAVVTNTDSGQIIGGIATSDSNDLLKNTGAIVGDIDLGDGNDVFNDPDLFISTLGTIDGSLYGGAGNDVLWASAGADSVLGGTGSDTVIGGTGADHLDGGAGRDVLAYDIYGIGSVSVDLAAGSATFPDDPAAGETITGFEDVVGSFEDDTIVGNTSNNRLVGEEGDDELLGGAGVDSLVGDQGSDTMRGGAGNDVLTSNRGEDVLIGGAGNDVFRFYGRLESMPSEMDRLVAGDGGAAFDGPGAASGDKIRLAEIDANLMMSGKQDFVFGTSKEIGHLWVENVGNVTHVRANLNNDAAPEFDLAIEDGMTLASAYTAADFVL